MKKITASLLSLAMILSAFAFAPAAAFAADDEIYVLMNIPYGDFYGSENAVDALSSATLAGKARNVNVNGASYHQSEAAVKEEGIAGVTYPVKTTQAQLDAMSAIQGMSFLPRCWLQMKAQSRSPTPTRSPMR